MVEMAPERKNRFIWIVAFAGIVVLAAGLYSGIEEIRGGGSSAESVIRLSLAKDLFTRDREGRNSRGYHMLIDSAAVPPLPTLATVPFVWIDGLGLGAGFYMLSAFLAAAAVMYLMVLARLAGLHWVFGPLAGVGLFWNPWIEVGPAGGTAITGSILFATAVCAHFVAWLRNGRLSSLALAANVLAFASLWDIRFLLVVPVGAGLIVGRLLGIGGASSSGGKTPKQESLFTRERLEGHLLLYLVPALYVPGLWFLFNWLIFGDPFRLGRDLPRDFYAATAKLTVLAAGLTVISYFLARCTRVWGAAVVGLYLAGVMGLTAPAVSRPSSAMAGLTGGKGSIADEEKDLKNLNRYLLETTGGRLVLVIGRPGYLVKPFVEKKAGFEHYLRVDPDLLERRTRGREVYLVLSKYQMEFWESRNRQGSGEERFLEDARFGDWRVYRLIKPKRTWGVSTI